MSGYNDEFVGFSRKCVFNDFPNYQNANGIQGREAELARTVKLIDYVKTWIGHARDEYDLFVEYNKRAPAGRADVVECGGEEVTV